MRITDAGPRDDRVIGIAAWKLYVGAMSGDASEMVFHSDCVMPHFSQRKTTRSPAVRAAHGTVSMVLNSI
jgi:hypothetical protein